MSKKGRSLKGGNVSAGGTPPLERIRGGTPRELKTIKGMRVEMSRVYRLVFENKIYPEDATKLIFILDKMVQSVRHEAEMNQLANAYQDAWSGVNIVPPEGGPALLAPAPIVEIIPPAKSEEIDHEHETE